FRVSPTDVPHPHGVVLPRATAFTVASAFQFGVCTDSGVRGCGVAVDSADTMAVSVGWVQPQMKKEDDRTTNPTARVRMHHLAFYDAARKPSKRHLSTYSRHPCGACRIFI